MTKAPFRKSDMDGWRAQPIQFDLIFFADKVQLRCGDELPFARDHVNSISAHDKTLGFRRGRRSDRTWRNRELDPITPGGLGWRGGLSV